MSFDCDFCHQNVQMYEEKEELVTIIKQAAKERLQMEKQLAKIRPNPVSCRLGGGNLWYKDFAWPNFSLMAVWKNEQEGIES